MPLEALIVIAYAPFAVGVPLIVQLGVVVAHSDRPGGKEPDVIVQVSVPVRLVTTFRLYAAPFTAPG